MYKYGCNCEFVLLDFLFRTPSRTPTTLRTPSTSPMIRTVEPSPSGSPKEEKAFVFNVECPSDIEWVSFWSNY